MYLKMGLVIIRYTAENNGGAEEAKLCGNCLCRFPKNHQPMLQILGKYGQICKRGSAVRLHWVDLL
jgi:hypothetical protein